LCNLKETNAAVVKIEFAIKVLDHHIERLETKLSFLIRSYDDPRTDLLYQYEKKITTVKQEIDDATEQRRTLIRLSQMGVITVLR
jgi:oligoribonuclease NrnB/cAMP/cGMP phosphodiesterase (DHH superfamily)